MAYHVRSWLAIATGVAAAGGALAILLQDPISTGQWRVDHGLLPVVVFVAIATGHLLGHSLKERSLFSALGFLMTFLLATGLTVYLSVGAQKAASGDKALSVESHNKAIADKRGELAKSRESLTRAEAQVERETANKRCAQACESWKQRAKEVRSHIAILEVQLADLGGEKIARPKASALAEAAAVFGLDRRKVETAATVLEPFAFSLLLEITAIVAFGFGFGSHRVAPEPVRQALTFERPLTDREVEDLRRILKSHGTLNNDAVAAAMGVTKSEASKRVAKAINAGVVAKQKTGREVAIRLLH